MSKSEQPVDDDKSLGKPVDDKSLGCCCGGSKVRHVVYLGFPGENKNVKVLNLPSNLYCCHAGPLLEMDEIWDFMTKGAEEYKRICQEYMEKMGLHEVVHPTVDDDDDDDDDEDEDETWFDEFYAGYDVEDGKDQTDVALGSVVDLGSNEIGNKRHPPISPLTSSRKMQKV